MRRFVGIAVGKNAYQNIRPDIRSPFILLPKVCNPGVGNAAARQSAGLAALVASGALTQSQADTFLDVHDRLLETGLMR